MGSIAFFCALAVVAQGNRAIAQTAVIAQPAHDGQHDFEFELGSWKIHLKKLLHPLTGSTTWVEFDGTSVTRKVWDGRAELEEFETNGAAGRIEGMTLRLYNPATHQWSLYWANSKNGSLDLPPNIGEFKDGRGEFLCQDTLDGRAILVRLVWSNITPTSAHSEQSFSDDGGRTWEVNWITDQTRTAEQAEDAPATATVAKADATAMTASTLRDGRHDFDYAPGDWKIHIKRLLHPLTGSTTWVEYDGTIATRRVWDGGAELEEFKAASPTGPVEGMTVRLYNPEAHQWNLYWATSKDGVLAGPPQVGEFNDGRGDFYSQDTFNGRAILIRYEWSATTTNTPHFEQAFSDDGGKTWEVNWITDQTRVQGDDAKGQ
jgi:hypothetical protein